MDSMGLVSYLCAQWVVIGVAVMLAYWGALQLLFRSLREAGPAHPCLTLGYAVIGALALGPGGTLLFLTRAGVYEEAIAWGVAFFMLALDRVWAWYRTGRRRALVMAVIFGVAAANARPSAAPACVVLGLMVVALSRWQVSRATSGAPAAADAVTRGGRRFVLAAALCLVLLPGLSAAGVFWLKFGTPLPDIRLNEQIANAPWWVDIRHRNGDHTAGLIFLPTELVVYLRPDAVTFSRTWPFVDFRFPIEPILWVPPLPAGGAYTNKFEPFTSATAMMPLPWLVTVSVAIWLGVSGWRMRHRRPPAWGISHLSPPDWIVAVGSLASAAGMVALVVTTIGITNRYLGDFYAITAVGMAVGPRVLLPLLGARPRFVAPFVLVAVPLVAWSMFAIFALNFRLVFL